MLFITYDPYSDNDSHEITINLDKVCIICHESNDYLLNYNTQPFYIVNCRCNCNIHYSCLNEYYNYNVTYNQICKCVICRDYYLLPSIIAPGYIKKIILLLFNFIKYYILIFLKIFLIGNLLLFSTVLSINVISIYPDYFIITFSGVTILFSLYYNSQIFTIIRPRYYD
jgi:hypothetical protein